jgi:hypothetical protein
MMNAISPATYLDNVRLTFSQWWSRITVAMIACNTMTGAITMMSERGYSPAGR